MPLDLSVLYVPLTIFRSKDSDTRPELKMDHLVSEASRSQPPIGVYPANFRDDLHIL
jgi:hypothetical protein